MVNISSNLPDYNSLFPSLFVWHRLVISENIESACIERARCIRYIFPTEASKSTLSNVYALSKYVSFDSWSSSLFQRAFGNSPFLSTGKWKLWYGKWKLCSTLLPSNYKVILAKSQLKCNIHLSVAVGAIPATARSLAGRANAVKAGLLLHLCLPLPWFLNYCWLAYLCVCVCPFADNLIVSCCLFVLLCLALFITLATCSSFTGFLFTCLCLCPLLWLCVYWLFLIVRRWTLCACLSMPAAVPVVDSHPSSMRLCPCPLRFPLAAGLCAPFRTVIVSTLERWLNFYLSACAQTPGCSSLYINNYIFFSLDNFISLLCVPTLVVVLLSPFFFFFVLVCPVPLLCFTLNADLLFVCMWVCPERGCFILFTGLFPLCEFVCVPDPLFPLQRWIISCLCAFLYAGFFLAWAPILLAVSCFPLNADLLSLSMFLLYDS